MKGYILAALVVVSGAQAQAKDRDGRGNEPVLVEVIGTGAVDIKASSQGMAISYTGRGKTSVVAEAAKARKEAEVLRLLAAEGVPATAISALSATEQAKLSLMGSLVGTGDTEQADALADASETAQGGRTVRVATLAQVNTLTAKLKAIGVQVGEPTPSFDNVAAARRDARLAALLDARAGADRYAAQLGMRVGGVRRVSETGAGLMLPGLQEKLSTMIATGGPGLMQSMLQPQKEAVKIEEAVVAEFALQP